MSVVRSGAFLLALLVTAALGTVPALAQTDAKPNILVIMGDDIGWFNIGAYHRGMMAGKTPNLDKLASEGMLFTDYYAEASCTAGRANFITGQLPIRTGLTTVGQAGATVGMPAQAPTIATVLKAMGYATGQFGKNHLGDRNEFLPTVHGFDEFFGYLYHLDAMEDPFHRNYPQELRDKVGPRNLLHTVATDTDDPTVEPRWGKVGKQKITDEGPLPPHPIDGIKYNMETFDEVIRDKTIDFIDKAKAAEQAVLRLDEPDAHARRHASLGEIREHAQRGERLVDRRSRHGADGRRHRRRAEAPQGCRASTTTPSSSSPPTTAPRTSPGPTAARRRSPAARAPRSKAASACRPSCAGRARSLAGNGRERHHLRARLVPDLRRRGRQSEHRGRSCWPGRHLGDQTYKVHLDGYNQLDLLTGKGPSARNEIFYFTETTLGAVRIDDYKYRFTDQPGGWLGNTIHLDWPILTNLKLDPFERTSTPQAVDVLRRLVRLRVLALRLRAAGSGEVRRELRRLPADADACVLQPRGGQGADHEGDPGAAPAIRRRP